MAAGDRRRVNPETVIAVGGLSNSQLRAEPVPVDGGDMSTSLASTAVSEQSPPTAITLLLAILQHMEVQTAILMEIRNLHVVAVNDQVGSNIEPGDLAEEGVH